MKAYRYIKQSGICVVQEEPNAATVTDFSVDPADRGKGVGHRLMEATCKDADRENVTLFLKPLPFGVYDVEEEKFYPPSLTFKQLCAFYREFGFRFMPGKEIMKRLPKEH